MPKRWAGAGYAAAAVTFALVTSMWAVLPITARIALPRADARWVPLRRRD